MANTPNDEPGNEARHTGDRLGFPHGVEPGKSLDAAYADDIAEGALVYHDGSVVQEAGDLSANPALGVLLTLPVEGDSSREGPYVRGDRDATIGVRGQYTADLSNFETDVGDVTTGAYLDPAQNVFVKANIEGSVYEVMVR